MHRLVVAVVLGLVVAVSGLASVAAQDASPAANPPVSLAGIQPLPLTDARLAEFESYVGSMLAKTGVPGASVAVVQNGEVVYRQGFGVRALGDDAPVTPDTLMMVGSVTKPMTATMAATLVDDGSLTWDTPVVDLLPTFAVADPNLTRRLTVRNAFCACMGLPQRDPEFIFNSAELTPERLITSVKDFPLTAPLGQRFQYSNQLFGIGGYAAAVAAAGGSGADLYDAYVAAMRERVLDPLGMSRSTFALDDVTAGGDYAEPHGLDLSGAYHPASLIEDERHVLSVAPAGALWSSASEMARYVQMELAGGVGPDGTRVVSRANLDATWQPQVAIPAPPAGAGVPPEFASMQGGYGLGWVTGDYRGQRLLWHSGGTFGFSTQAALLPDAGLGLVVLTNGINAQFFTYAVQFRLFELAFGQPAAFDPVVTAGLAAEAQQTAELQRQLGRVDPAVAAPYLGSYSSEVLGQVEIALGEGILVLDAGDFRAELRPLRDAGGTTYLTSDLPLAGPATVAFARDGGAPTMTFTDPTTGEVYAFAFGGAVQAATPAPYPVAPDPAECTVEPRPLADVVAVVGTPTSGAATPIVPVAASPEPFVVPAGQPADPATAAAAIATLRQVFACTNAGDLLRVFALFTDDFVRDFFVGTPMTPEVEAFLAAPPRPLPREELRVIVRFGEAQLLADGRLGVPIVLDEPSDPRTEEPDYAILEQVDGRWLVDEIHEDPAGSAGTPTT